MIPRYSRSEMERIWKETNRLNLWVKIELAACEAMEGLGHVPRGTAAKLRESIGVLDEKDVARVVEIEKTTRHDVIAFLTVLEQKAGPDSRFLHLGLTSYDVVDTSFSLQLVEATGVLLEDLKKLADILMRRAIEFKNTPQIGRSHGIHAEPVTFGLKLLAFWDEVMRGIVRLTAARDAVAVGKISGAVGTYANVEPSVEDYVCGKVGLSPARDATQVLPRDNHAQFFMALALIASSMERFAVELRHLQRTEVHETEEFFRAGQKGSSAMPHKRNPVLTENITGLARLVRSYASAALENVVLWHERDISHSSTERVIAPDATIALDFMIDRMAGVVDKLTVYPDMMMKNLNLSGGLIFSEAVLLALCGKGMMRQNAYVVVQRNAMKAWAGEGDFKSLLASDLDASKLMTRSEIDACFDLKHHLRHVDFIFQKTVEKWKDSKVN